MIILDTTTRSLEFKLGGTVTTNQLPFVSFYTDHTSAAYTPISQNGVSNNTTAVTIVTAPAASTQRAVKYINIRNRDTISETVTLQYNDNGTIRELFVVVLSVDDTLTYTDVNGWEVINTSGQKKSIASITGNVTVVQPTGTNLHSVLDSGTLTTITNVVHIDDNAGSLTVDGAVTANAGTNLNTSLLSTEATLDARTGILTETAPSTDTASSGLNGRLQRIAQRLTSLIALLPSALVGGRLDVNIGASAATVTIADTNVDNATLVDNAGFTDGTTRLLMTGYILDDTAGTALTENDAAAGRISTNRAVVNVIEDGATRARYATVTAGNAVKVDNSAVTQPVSGTITASNTAGDIASGATDSGNPVKIGAQARTTDITPVTSAQRVNLIADTLGKLVVLQGSVHDLQSNGTTNYTTTTAADVIAAAGAGVRIAVTSILATNAHATVASKVEIRDGTTVKIIGHCAAAGGGFSLNSGGRPLFITTANTAATARAVTTGADIDVSISGYKIAN